MKWEKMSATLGRRLCHAVATTLGLAMLMSVASVYTPVAAVADALPVNEGEKALKAAAASGKPVEVLGERTESTTTYANPDGKSFRLDTSAVPVRVKAKDGAGWVAPDAMLQVRPDGTVGPKATLASVGFSGGGDSSLVTIGHGGRTMSLGWQGESCPSPCSTVTAPCTRRCCPGSTCG